jgi:DNA-binding NarL/FixJ family response regulator
VLTHARDGQSAVLVLGGEPGIGKTALVRYAARQASGFQVAHVEGVQAEMELPFSGIHGLCAPLLDALEQLPEPQQNALRVALGQASGDAPDKFRVAVAVLNLLAGSAAERPLLCLVDDAQWLDAASAQVLGFVARRLRAEPMAMIFALREPATIRALDGLTRLPIAGLAESDARVLLSRAVPGRLDERVRDRIIGETRGNPLALVQLSQGMKQAERAGGFVPPTTGDLPSRMEERYLRRVAALPEPTQRLILLAAAEPLGDAALLWRAADGLSIEQETLAPATAAGLLEIDDHVRFHHPLLRSAVYRAAQPEERRRVHAALAAASDPEVSADSRAWHQGLAAPEPEEAVAAELERCAGRAQSRGGLVAAAALLERAAALTPDPRRQAERALDAAVLSFQVGDFEMALRLLATASSGPLDDLQRARAALLRGQAALVSSYGSEAGPLLLQAARQLEPLDLSFARRAYLTAWAAAVTAGRLGEAGMLLEVSCAIRALPPLPPEPAPLDLVIDALAMLVTDGVGSAMPTLQRAGRALIELPIEDVLRWGWITPSVRSTIWDDDALAVYERHARLVREAGALAELPIHLQALAIEIAWRGDLSGARQLIAEAESISESIGNTVPPFALLRVLALEGRETEALPLIRRATEEGIQQGQGNAVMVAHWAAAVLYNGLARYEEAAAAADEVVANALLPHLSMWARCELIEAAAHLESDEMARKALDDLVATTQPANSYLALGIEARCRALLANEDAEELYRTAIEELNRAKNLTEQARAHLVFGEWLRGQGRGREAREQLRSAEDMFVEIGMEAFAERARLELVAAGARPRTRPLEPGQELTPQEAQIARLAQQGLTNAQIGTELFLSARTVEWHLHKAFGKLGIDSRGALEVELPRGQRERV